MITGAHQAFSHLAVHPVRPLPSSSTPTQIPAGTILLARSPHNRFFICLPISILVPSLSLSNSLSTPLDLSPKMAPQTLHSVPGVAQDGGQRRGAPNLCKSWDAKNFPHLPSAHPTEWVVRHTITPKVKSAGRRKGKWKGRTIQVQRHGDGSSGGSLALPGEGAPSAAARWRIEEGAMPPHPSLECKSPPQSTQSIHSSPKPLCCLAPALCFGPHPEKPRKIHSLRTRAFRQRTYREDPGVVSLSLLLQFHPKHREHTRPSGLGPQLRER